MIVAFFFLILSGLYSNTDTSGIFLKTTFQTLTQEKTSANKSLLFTFNSLNFHNEQLFTVRSSL